MLRKSVSYQFLLMKKLINVTVRKKMSEELLKTMIMHFRVTDLQSVLEYAGETDLKRRKKDLQKKALKLVSTRRTVGLSCKIRILYENLNHKRTKNSSNVYSRRSKLNYKDYSYNDIYDSNHYDSTNFVERNYFHNNEYLKNLIKNFNRERLCDITFKKLTFFEFESDILLVTPLIPRDYNEELYEFNISFSTSNKRSKLLNTNAVEYSPEILLRMCILNDEKEVDDELPPSLSVLVNNTFCTLPAAIPSTNRHGLVIRRMNLPVNITTHIKPESTINSLIINWSPDCNLYGIAVHQVRKINSDELINRLKEKGERDPEFSKKILETNLNDSDDNDIAATSLKMSLICPLGKILMSLPVRGTVCNHLQCFDGSSYIRMNEIKCSWQCPICNQTCLYEDLFIDGYFMNILRNRDFTPNVTDVQLDADGSWTAVSNTNQKHNVNILRNENIETNNCESDRNKLVNRNGFVDKVRNFLSQFEENSNDSNRSVFPVSPQYDNVIEDSNTFDSNSLHSDSRSSDDTFNSSNKRIILVDLTESNSDTDEMATVFTDEIATIYSNSSYSDDEPPVYDIYDSDDSS